MLRLPQDLQLYITIISGNTASIGASCQRLHALINTPESLLRLYLAKRHNEQQQQGCGGLRAVYSLLLWGRLSCWARTESGALKTIQMLLECSNAVKAVPSEKQQLALKALQDSSTADVAKGVQLLQSVLPYAEHCLLPFCAYGGHVQLVKALLPLTHAPVLFHSSMLHYVRTSAFFAAAAGGQAQVLSELLAAGAASWACQLPGVSLTSTALDLAAQGGHLQAMQLLQPHVRQPSSTFLSAVAAGDSSSGQATEWALGFWFGQFNAVTGFSTAHIQQMHDALRVACQAGHLPVIRCLLRYLAAVRCHDCCVLALSYTCATSNTEAMKCILDSPYLPQQLARGGPKLLEQLVMVVASCLRIAIRIHNMPSLELLLFNLTSSTSPLAAVRQHLGPQMASVFDQAATAGNGPALQLLLTRLPEHYSALGLPALEGALSEGHADLAWTIKTLLAMRGPEEGFSADMLNHETSPAVARASRQGALKSAAASGDVVRLTELLHAGPEGPDDNEQLLLLRLAAAAGREAAVRLLLGEFGGGTGSTRSELCLRAVCRAAVHAGQLELVKNLSCDSSLLLLGHLDSQPDALGEYMRAALLCGRVEMAAWLVHIARQRRQLGVVAAALQSLLTTSRWELWNTGMGRSAREAVAALLKALAAQPAAAVDAAAGAGPASTEQPSQSAAAARIAGSGEASSVLSGSGQGAAEGTAGISAAMPHAAAAAAAHATVCEQLLTPQVLRLLLQASAGDPSMLFSVVDLVHAWGLAALSKEQQQQPLGSEVGKQQQEETKETAGGRSNSSSADGLQQQQQCPQLNPRAPPTLAASTASTSTIASGGSSSSYTTVASRTSSGGSSDGSGNSSCGFVGEGCFAMRSSSTRDAAACCCVDSHHHQVCYVWQHAAKPGIAAAAAAAGPCGSSSWPTVLGGGSSPSDGGCADATWLSLDQRLHPAAAAAGCSGGQGAMLGLRLMGDGLSSSPGAHVDWLARIDGVAHEVGGAACSKGSRALVDKAEKLQLLAPRSNSNSSRGSPLRPRSTVEQAGAVGSMQTRCSQQQQPQQQCVGVGSTLKQLTGRVEQLTVSSTGQQQQQLSSKPLRRESQPLHPSYSQVKQPLRTSVSLPLPKGAFNSHPLHPYMQYHAQRQQQQQQQEPSGSSGGAAGGSSSTTGTTTIGAAAGVSSGEPSSSLSAAATAAV